ncbi:aminotransferase [Rhizobium laguerreae]|uniref:aminotransferase n=1 Tax=Rhizobium laguerreae TaxID=1076926 RepID=UPI001C911558|nr:aminotransferase [Rhizobium laguerreae]MBY3348379.1 aminotransferase [Rhizobium laguerreae]MBY3355397.1 aminotransferase [Rhizobium laguerreae]MBY3369288.1 aminotransferase [Rhizobium laguerreae]MBY3376533.1 aminotransferase [Rhizobium laguerreae]MBY3390607.1 aminotransferase [Rhizobium laguerreae]
MKIRDFGVEIWMNKYETRCELNLAETCVESLTVAELLDMSGVKDIAQQILPLKLTYGEIEGSLRLRALIAGLYEQQKVENVVTTHGAIGANALVHQTIVEPGDRVISVLPTYQQHYSIPESIGADTQILRLTEETGFLPDLEKLKKLAVSGTKLIAINNPNNPTGCLMDRVYLEKIVEIARACGAWILCDEVYRGTDQEGDTGMTASIADLYEKGISTGSMSKTFSLAGLRLGWIVAPAELIHAVSIHRDYNTISVGMLDDHFASIALECKDKILERSHKITRTNLAIVSQWVDGEPLISWIKPKSGTTALLKYDVPIASEEFCLRLLDKTGVMLTPGSALDMEGYLRIGYTNGEDVLRKGLERISLFLKESTASAA